MLDSFVRPYVAQYRPYKGGAWCYEDGCIYRGLEILHRATGDGHWLAELTRLVDAQLAADGTLAGYDPDEFNIDNILSGRALLYLHSRNGAARYMAAADRLADQLARHPRTASGVFWHKKRYPEQVWLDGLYMGLPFLIGYGQATGRDDLVGDALSQGEIALDLARDPATGLYAHGVDESRAQPWADPVTGRSRAYWGRALGWLAMALADCHALAGSDPRGGWIAPALSDLLDRLAALRTPGDAWLQVVDQPGLSGNYEEGSASAMIHYATLTAALDGLDGLDAEASATRAIRFLRAFLVDGEAGRPVLRDICEVAGLGMFHGIMRSGTAEYYLSEARVRDDAKGVGPAMALMGRLIQAGSAESLLRSEHPARPAG